VANVSTEGVRVNGNPPRADYGSNRPHYRTGARGRLAPGSWLLAKSPFSGIGKTSFREGFRGWFKAQEPDRARRGRFQYRCRQGSGSATCDMACSCHEIGTKVEFTLRRMGRIFSVSRPGGGLFGRPITRESLGRFLFVGFFFAISIRAPTFCPCRKIHLDRRLVFPEPKPGSGDPRPSHCLSLHERGACACILHQGLYFTLRTSEL
jgi:hypothetical protein